jgi:hypothetical protein
MRKEFIEYVTDMVSFYKKHRKFILKVMAIYAAFCAAIMAYYKWYHEIHECLQRLKMKILGKKEELTSGGLDYEAPEEEGEDDNSVVASF